MAEQKVSFAGGADKSAFTKRLHMILAHWPSTDRLARAMGVSPSAFRKWLKGEAEPSRERLIALSRAAGVSVAWLAEGEGPEPSFETSIAGRRKGRTAETGGETEWGSFVIIPDQTGFESGRSPGRYLAMRQDWVRSVVGVEAQHLVLDVATDEAMSPTIKPHDTVLLDTTERRIVGNGIYVLDIGNQRQIRRVQRRHDGSLVLISDNQTYQPDVVGRESASAITVLGRVVWVGGMV
ncbi:MAG TPA: S24 family peptidase [Rhodopila sp.]|uniref:XRE family transcriptional regulator n=1 Tax=Rhodopila sp. TaxID=2480087 RepID=UPI002BC360F4|nr:S24 family peptidase [Rhodopila sp.]HVY14572.1 S24 family peptidase [Rhodopila sp.]